MNKSPMVSKDILREAYLVNYRILTVAIFTLLLLVAIMSRLLFLQWVNYEIYHDLSQKNTIDISPIAPARGLLFDRNGELIATNSPVYSLDIIPDRVKNIKETIDAIKLLIPLSDSEIKQFYKSLNQKRKLNQVPLKLALTEEQLATFAVNQQNFSGVIVNTRLLRRYEHGTTMAHITGSMGQINEQELPSLDATNYSATTYIGKTGIEKYYEQQLHGHVGYEKTIVDAKGKKIKLLEKLAPVSGDNLYLTIDLGLQKAALKELEGHRGAIIAIDPQNGEILALASMPTYDPQIFTSGISTTDYNALLNDPNKPLFNRAINGLYPIGSTIKPFIALAGLYYGVITTETKIQDKGYYQLPNSTHIFNDWLRTGHGEVDFRKAVAVSCDPYFYELAYKLGIRHIVEFLTEFGLGKLTHIDLAEESQSNIPSPAVKKIFSDEPWSPADTIMTGIGQSYTQITPIDLAYAMNILANRGKGFQPHLLKAISNERQQKIMIQSVPLTPVILPDSHWDAVIQGMEDVIKQTYGFNFHFGLDAVYSAAGKTGTAQVVGLRQNNANLPEKFHDHSLFEGFAPVDNPKIVVVVILENAKLAAKAARHVMDYYLVEEKKL